jgi:hypothetical protein
MDSNFTKKQFFFPFLSGNYNHVSPTAQKNRGNPIIYCSAVFEIESSSRVLMPRMDTSQRTGIISPAEGFAGLRY